jgi:hypothetical protein
VTTPNHFPPLPPGYEAARLKVSKLNNLIYAVLKGSPTLVLDGGAWVELAAWAIKNKEAFAS